MAKEVKESNFKPRIAENWDPLDGPPQMEYYYNGDSYNEAGYYPQDSFITAALNGNLKMCKEFLEQGIDVNVVRYKSRETALHVAARNCHLELCKLLLENGAKVNLRSPDNETPLMVATETASGRTAEKSLNNALQTCEVLIQHGADVNVIGGPSGKLTLKYYSTTRNDNPALTKLLEESGLIYQERFIEETATPLNGEDSGNNDGWCTIL